MTNLLKIINEEINGYLDDGPSINELFLTITPFQKEQIIFKTMKNLRSDSFLSNYVEFVPINFLKKIKEFDREQSSPYEHFKELMDDILENGLTDALFVGYHPINDTVLLEEGNHRLVIFEKLKFFSLPVIVSTRRIPWENNQKYKLYNIQGLKDKEKYVDKFPPHEYRLPTYMKPNLVGIPTTQNFY